MVKTPAAKPLSNPPGSSRRVPQKANPTPRKENSSRRPGRPVSTAAAGSSEVGSQKAPSARGAPAQKQPSARAQKSRQEGVTAVKVERPDHLKSHPSAAQFDAGALMMMMDEQNEAAAKLQAVKRGQQARAQVNGRKQPELPNHGPRPAHLANHASAAQFDAAQLEQLVMQGGSSAAASGSKQLPPTELLPPTVEQELANERQRRVAAEARVAELQAALEQAQARIADAASVSALKQRQAMEARLEAVVARLEAVANGESPPAQGRPPAPAPSKKVHHRASARHHRPEDDERHPGDDADDEFARAMREAANLDSRVTAGEFNPQASKLKERRTTVAANYHTLPEHTLSSAGGVASTDALSDTLVGVTLQESVQVHLHFGHTDNVGVALQVGFDVQLDIPPDL